MIDTSHICRATKEFLEKNLNGVMRFNTNEIITLMPLIYYYLEVCED